MDFGKLHHHASKDNVFGLIIIRTHDQRIEHVNLLLEKFIANLGEQTFSKNPHALVVIEDAAIRTIIG